MCRTLNVLFFIAGTAMAQDSFLDTPTRRWQVTVPPMGEGNGIVMETDDRAVFATSSDGTITALDPDDGSKNWDFQPPAGNGTVPLSSNGQVAISQDKKFMVYSVTEDADSENAIW
jgi:outer membrane protein assembly factor BamB